MELVKKKCLAVVFLLFTDIMLRIACDGSAPASLSLSGVKCQELSQYILKSNFYGNEKPNSLDNVKIGVQLLELRHTLHNMIVPSIILLMFERLLLQIFAAR